jgi:hypothetical protein
MGERSKKMFIKIATSVMQRLHEADEKRLSFIHTSAQENALLTCASKHHSRVVTIGRTLACENTTHGLSSASDFLPRCTLLMVVFVA